MKYKIGDIVYGSKVNKHGLIVNYLKDNNFPNAPYVKCQVLCLEDGKTYEDTVDNLEKLTIKVA